MYWETPDSLRGHPLAPRGAGSTSSLSAWFTGRNASACRSWDCSSRRASARGCCRRQTLREVDCPLFGVSGVADDRKAVVIERVLRQGPVVLRFASAIAPYVSVNGFFVPWPHLARVEIPQTQDVVGAETWSGGLSDASSLPQYGCCSGAGSCFVENVVMSVRVKDLDTQFCLARQREASCPRQMCFRTPIRGGTDVGGQSQKAFPSAPQLSIIPRSAHRSMFGWVRAGRSTDNESGSDRFELDPFGLFGDAPSRSCWYGQRPTLFDAPSRSGPRTP